MENMNDIRKTRLVFDARIARALCKRNLPIVDIKPNRENREKTIFIFNNTDEFNKIFDEVINEFKAKNEEEKEPVETAD